MITILDHPIVHHNMAILRDKNTCTEDFRKAADAIGTCLAYTAFQNLTITRRELTTPMEDTDGFYVSSEPVFVPILRAGIALLEPFQRMFPKSKTGFIGIRRNETTLQAEEYMFSFPKVNPNTKVYVLDVMLATGASLKATLGRLQLEGVEDVTVAAVIAAPEGIESLMSEFVNVNLIVAALDRGLNDKGYILPGLGDAGDRITGLA